MWLATGGEEVGMLSFCGTRERAWGRCFRGGGGFLRSAATESRRATVSGQLPLLMFLQGHDWRLSVAIYIPNISTGHDWNFAAHPAEESSLSLR
jgi:hypothetical protein